jgi:DNA polymerase phi
MIGKLFAYKAVLLSSILIEPKLAMDSWNGLLDLIYGMARDTPWLREECALVLVQTIETLPAGANIEPCVRALSERLVSYKIANTPEGIAIWLALQEEHASILPANVWHDNDPLSMKNRPKLAKVLKGDIQSSLGSDESEAVKSAATNANPQFAWNTLLSKVLQMDSESEASRTDASKSQFGQLWLNIVDGELSMNYLTITTDRTSATVWDVFLARTQILGFQIIRADDWPSPRVDVSSFIQSELHADPPEPDLER